MIYIELSLYIFSALILCFPGYTVYRIFNPNIETMPISSWQRLPMIEVYFLISLATLLPPLLIGMFFKVSINYILLYSFILSFLGIIYFIKKHGIVNIQRKTKKYLKSIPITLCVFFLTSLLTLIINAETGSDGKEAIARASNSLDNLDILFGTGTFSDGIRIEIIPMLTAMLCRLSQLNPYLANFTNGMIFTFLGFLAWYRLFFMLLRKHSYSLISCLIFFIILVRNHTLGFFEFASYESTNMVTFFFPVIFRYFFLCLKEQSENINQQRILALLLLVSGTWHKCLSLHLGMMIPLTVLIYWIAFDFSKLKSVINLKNICLMAFALGIVILSGNLIEFSLHENDKLVSSLSFIGAMFLFFSAFSLSLKKGFHSSKTFFSTNIAYFIPLILSGLFLYLTSLSDAEVYSSHSRLGEHTSAGAWKGYIYVNPSMINKFNAFLFFLGIFFCVFSSSKCIKKFAALLFCFSLSAAFMMFFPPWTSLATETIPLWALDRVRYYFWTLGPFAITLGVISHISRIKFLFYSKIQLLLYPALTALLIYATKPHFAEGRIASRILEHQLVVEELNKQNDRHLTFKLINDRIKNTSQEITSTFGNTARPFDDKFFYYNALRGLTYERVGEPNIRKLAEGLDPKEGNLGAVYILSLNEDEGYFGKRKKQILESPNFDILFSDELTIVLFIKPYPWNLIKEKIRKFDNTLNLAIFSNTASPNHNFFNNYFHKNIQLIRDKSKIDKILSDERLKPSQYEFYLINLNEDGQKYKALAMSIENRIEFDILFKDSNFIFFKQR